MRMRVGEGSEAMRGMEGLGGNEGRGRLRGDEGLIRALAGRAGTATWCVSMGAMPMVRVQGIEGAMGPPGVEPDPFGLRAI